MKFLVLYIFSSLYNQLVIFMLLYFLLLLRVILWFESQKCMIKPYHYYMWPFAKKLYYSWISTMTSSNEISWKLPPPPEMKSWLCPCSWCSSAVAATCGALSMTSPVTRKLLGAPFSPVVPNRGGIPPQGGISWVQGRNFHFIIKLTVHCKCWTSF